MELLLDSLLLFDLFQRITKSTASYYWRLHNAHWALSIQFKLVRRKPFPDLCFSKDPISYLGLFVCGWFNDRRQSILHFFFIPRQTVTFGYPRFSPHFPFPPLQWIILHDFSPRYNRQKNSISSILSSFGFETTCDYRQRVMFDKKEKICSLVFDVQRTTVARKEQRIKTSNSNVIEDLLVDDDFSSKWWLFEIAQCTWRN